MGVVQDLVDNADIAMGKVLNALDFPLAGAFMEPTIFASDAHAFQHTMGEPTIEAEKLDPGHFK